MLKSSSISGQWIPLPPPMSRQFARSDVLACLRRGYQADGTESDRPSDSSTLNVSSVTETLIALGEVNSVAEIVIPSLQQLRRVICNMPLDLAKFSTPESAAVCEAYGIEPEFGDHVVALNVYVGWLMPVTRVEEEAIRANPQNCGHLKAPRDSGRARRGREWFSSVPRLGGRGIWEFWPWRHGLAEARAAGNAAEGGPVSSLARWADVLECDYGQHDQQRSGTANHLQSCPDGGGSPVSRGRVFRSTFFSISSKTERR